MYSGRDQLEQFMREEFAFLVAQHGYLETLGKREAMFTVLYYSKQLLGFRVVLDYRDQTLYPDLIRPPAGLKPKVSYIVDNQVVRVPLLIFLEDMLHIADKKVTILAQTLGSGSLDFQGALEGVVGLREIIPSVEVFNHIMRS
jgi:hypothetical protein